MITRYSATLAVLLFCTSAHSELSLNGSAIYNDLGKEQFVAGLFVDTLYNNAHTPQLADRPKPMQIPIPYTYSTPPWLSRASRFIKTVNALVALLTSF